MVCGTAGMPLLGYLVECCMIAAGRGDGEARHERGQHCRIGADPGSLRRR